MDLFNKPEIKGFSSDVAKELANIYDDHLGHENTMYPFNHIRVAAMYGKRKLVKPQKGLAPVTAKILKEQNYDVTFNIETNKWTISWE